MRSANTAANHIRASRIAQPSNILRCQTCNISLAPSQIKRASKVLSKPFVPVKVVKKKESPAPPPAERPTWLDLIKPIVVENVLTDHTPHPNARLKRKPESSTPSTQSAEPTQSATSASSPASSSSAKSSTTQSSSSHITQSPPKPSPSLPSAPEPAPEAEADESSMTDEEFEEYLHAPLKRLPSFDEVESEIDSLLQIDMRGVRMFPKHMHDQLKLDAMKFTAEALAEIKAMQAPITQHQLQSRVFSFLINRATKLAHTEDERITILCPDAPFVGDKVPHPQWPEMTTVVRRFFSHSDSSYMSVPMPRPRTKDGKVRWSELVGANVKSPLDETVIEHEDMQDDWVDVNQIDEKAILVGEEKEYLDALERATEDSQRYMIQQQIETRRQMRETIIARIQLLRRQINNKLTPADRKSLTELARANSATENVKHELAVVYKFDGSGDEFEMRYPLSTRDVERLKLFQEPDVADSDLKSAEYTTK